MYIVKWFWIDISMVAIVWPCAIDCIRKIVLIFFSSRSWPTNRINKSKIQAIQNHCDFTSLSLLISLLLNMLQSFYSKTFPHIQAINFAFALIFFIQMWLRGILKHQHKYWRERKKKRTQKTFCEEAEKHWDEQDA